MARTKAKTKSKDSSKRAADLINGNTSESIAAQIDAFLASGNKIQEIPVGTSGITHTGGTKHITISRKQ